MSAFLANCTEKLNCSVLDVIQTLLASIPTMHLVTFAMRKKVVVMEVQELYPEMVIGTPILGLPNFTSVCNQKHALTMEENMICFMLRIILPWEKTYLMHASNSSIPNVVLGIKVLFAVHA